MRAAPSWFFPHPVVPQGQDWEKWQEQTQSRAELARLEGQQQKSAPSCELERAAGGMPQSQEAAEIAAFFVYNYLAVLVFEQQLADSVHDVDAYTPRAICAGLAWGSPSAHATAGATPGLTARGCRDCSNNRKQQQQQQQQPVLLSSSSSAGEEREGGFFFLTHLACITKSVSSVAWRPRLPPSATQDEEVSVSHSARAQAPTLVSPRPALLPCVMRHAMELRRRRVSSQPLRGNRVARR